MIEETQANALDEFGRSVLTDTIRRRKEISSLRAQLRLHAREDRESASFVPDPGISVIVPTYRGQERIGALLESLAAQTIDHSRFEVIIVENGVRGGVEQVVENYTQSLPSLQLRYFYRSRPSAGGARNLGIDLARYSRITFVDDDDTVGPAFLSDALELSTGNNMVLSPIINVQPDGEEVADNPLNMKIAQIHGTRGARVVDAPWALGFNACKLVPTWMLRDLRFDEELKSGEDLVFWAQLAVRAQTPLVAVKPGTNAAYFRGLRDDSVSRKALDLDFAVRERLACIEALEHIDVPYASESARCIDQLARAQTGFIARYIAANPDDRDVVLGLIEERALRSFPWSVLNAGQARDLAFVYCFAPFSDTSAVVAAKAIAERERLVDVISNDMSTVRRHDPAVSALADRWIDKRTLIDARPSFAGWDPISDFARKAVAAADRDHALKGPYETVYSRALWAGSHVAAALFKLRHWSTKWTAEFSDPLRRDAEGNPRQGAVGTDETWERLVEGVRSRGFVEFEPETVFDLVEVATFVLADELLFTNNNQLEYMLSLTRDLTLRALVKKKAVVREHPQPPSSAYDVVKTDYHPPANVVNIAYFGSFYPNRGIGDVLTAFANLRTDIRRQLRLHVFSNKIDDVKESARSLGVGAFVHSQGYLSYMEFLNATSLFDVLLVNDVERNENLSINPFLPSKLSDYRGSGSKIWGLVDEGSPLSTKKLDFVSPVGNAAAITNTLMEIAATKSGHTPATLEHGSDPDAPKC